MISNRGTQVWPTGSVYTECVNAYRIRVESKDEQPVPGRVVFELAEQIDTLFHVAGIEMLHVFAGKKGFSLAQGQ